MFGVPIHNNAIQYCVYTILNINNRAYRSRQKSDYANEKDTLQM